MAKIETLKDNNNETVYPITQTGAVIDPNGNTLETRLSNDEQSLSGKVGMTDLLPLWSGYCLTGSALATSEFSWTTKRGKVLDCRGFNGGTGFCVVKGGEDVNLFRQYWGVQFSTSITGYYRIWGVSNSTTYTRLYGKENNGSATTMTEASRSTAGSTSIYGVTVYFSDTADTSGSKTSTQCEITGVRAFPGSTRWRIFGKMGSAGTLTTMSFEIECVAATAGTLPTLYNADANNTNAGGAWNYLEVLETT